jgi:hypothetical protein
MNSQALRTPPVAGLRARQAGLAPSPTGAAPFLLETDVAVSVERRDKEAGDTTLVFGRPYRDATQVRNLEDRPARR